MVPFDRSDTTATVQHRHHRRGGVTDTGTEMTMTIPFHMRRACPSVCVAYGYAIYIHNAIAIAIAKLEMLTFTWSERSDLVGVVDRRRVDAPPNSLRYDRLISPHLHWAICLSFGSLNGGHC